MNEVSGFPHAVKEILFDRFTCRISLLCLTALKFRCPETTFITEAGNTEISTIFMA